MTVANNLGSGGNMDYDNDLGDSIVSLLAQLVVGHKDEYDDVIDCPVGMNRSVSYSNGTFRLSDYCWCDGRVHGEDRFGNLLCPPNFVFFETGASCEWYKHMGRSQHWDRPLSREECERILVKCLKSLNIE